MDAYELKRRDFLKKLGLIAGATAVVGTGVSGVAEIINDQKGKFILTEDQKIFMDKYESWLEEFHDMAKFQKGDPEHLDNNKKLMALSDDAKIWQKDLIEYMKDENFARYYMVVTERVTTSI